MNQFLISSIIAAMMMVGPGLCWVDITSDALLKSAINQANTNYIATFVLMYADPYFCPTILNQLRQNKVNIQKNMYSV
jgi:hypothetical protein